MKIGEFLKHSRQRLVTCRPDDTLTGVAKLLYANGIGAMPVCETGQLLNGCAAEDSDRLRCARRRFGLHARLF